jgi:hypothetical protein
MFSFMPDDVVKKLPKFGKINFGIVNKWDYLHCCLGIPPSGRVQRCSLQHGLHCFDERPVGVGED